jgi:hypothetical protein
VATYCLLDADALSGDDYPTTRGGFTFGWEDRGGGNPRGRNRDSGVNAKLAGINFTNDGLTRNLRIDLSGSLKVRLGIGDAAVGQSNAGVDVRDSAGSKFSHSGLTVGPSAIYDATGVSRSSAADWVSNNAQSAAFTFADYVRVRLDGAGTASVLAHVEVEEQAAAGQPTTRRFGMVDPDHGRSRVVEIGRSGTYFARRRVA